MLLDSFIKKYHIGSEKELDRVLFVAFYHLKHSNVRSFTFDDIVEWFGTSNWSTPNRSRLLQNMKKSKHFVRGDVSDSHKIHGKTVEQLEEKFSDFDFNAVYLKLNRTSGQYVDSSRIEQLKELDSPDFDLAKIIEICEELNSSVQTKSLLAIALLVRTMIDHVPPIFHCKNFQEVSNNYPGSASFKLSMQNLDKSSRKIADRIVHTQIRKSETLPTTRQVDFTNDLDVLLEEIVRILQV